MPSVPNFPERLRFHRLKLKLSQEQLGDKIGVSQNAIGTWERGESSPQIPELLQLCDLFDLAVEYLTGRSDFEHGLSPDSWIIDLDKVENPVDGDDWSYKVPRRMRIATYEEMRKIEDSVNAARRAAARKSKRGRDERS